MKDYKFYATHPDLKHAVRGTISADSALEATGKICIRIANATNTDRKKLTAPTSIGVSLRN